MTTWQPPDPRMAEVIKVAREYFGPEAEQWPDNEVVHQLLIAVLDLRRQINDLKPRKPILQLSQSRYSKL